MAQYNQLRHFILIIGNRIQNTVQNCFDFGLHFQVVRNGIGFNLYLSRG
jgi:hypothetical protein